MRKMGIKRSLIAIDGRAMNAELQFFNPNETRILEALIVNMVGIDPADVPKVQVTDAVGAIDTLVAKLPAALRTQLRAALHLFQWSPIFFIGSPRPFTRLSAREAEKYLRSWAESRFGQRRRLFRGLRDLTFLGYYSQTGAQKSMGHQSEMPLAKDL
jgi:hypothetical protein